MMAEMGSCKKGNMKSLINEKWRYGEINRLIGFPSEEMWPTHSLK